MPGEANFGGECEIPVDASLLEEVWDCVIDLGELRAL
jgi:hypothetical protein